ncbi:gas vesicle protein K [Comamonas sp. JC664]|uniref:gas vesicle protein K n=1 Tax=Comamonas sp. JC664 TaxID=2801917 RepID=UPI00174B09AC|nr:gas vesicle protein K [Comamonas sp. JC664]MBL0694839.1 gas vesicle protein K [Comamonas sp. JC664]GHG94840.1 gas vesicle protein GvpK [Comamonas sp. KCTC 72670]
MAVEGAPQAVEELARALEPAKPPRLELDEENVQAGLVQLVLAVVELIRQLLERQALRRIDAGSLSEEQIERLGVTFLRLQEQMDVLKKQFDLTDEDLNLDLGPLGTTL